MADRTYNDAALARAGLTRTDLAALTGIDLARRLVGKEVVCRDLAPLSSLTSVMPENLSLAAPPRTAPKLRFRLSDARRALPTPDEEQEIARILSDYGRRR